MLERIYVVYVDVPLVSTVKGPFVLVPWVVMLYPFDIRFCSNSWAVRFVPTFRNLVSESPVPSVPNDGISAF